MKHLDTNEWWYLTNGRTRKAYGDGGIYSEIDYIFSNVEYRQPEPDVFNNFSYNTSDHRPICAEFDISVQTSLVCVKPNGTLARELEKMLKKEVDLDLHDMLQICASR